MRLCFGTFASVLVLCKRNINKTDFVARIAKCVDPHSSYIDNDDRYKEGKWDIQGDKSAVSKLRHCTKDFVIGNDSSVKRPDIVAVIETLKERVIPYIQEDKKAVALLALLDIIRRDESLDADRNELFQEYIGIDKQQLLQQQKISFADFIGRVLLFTTYGDRNNTVGKDCVKSITPQYLDEVTSVYTNECRWDRSEQVLSLTYISTFFLLNETLESCQLAYFIENVDPTNLMEDVWIEKCEEFQEMMQSGVEALPAPNKRNVQGFTLKKTQEFCQVLNDYTEYLGVHMRPIANTPETFVPLYRDENTKWAFSFAGKVQAYRERLETIYKEIYTHMPFAPNDYK